MWGLELKYGTIKLSINRSFSRPRINRRKIGIFLLPASLVKVEKVIVYRILWSQFSHVGMA